MSSSKLQATAHHEAGHAVVACIKGIPVTEVSIIPEEGVSLGHTLTDPAEDVAMGQYVDLLEAAVKFGPQLLAGCRAETRFAGGLLDTEAHSRDMEAVSLLMDEAGICDKIERTAFLDWLEIHTVNLIYEPRVWGFIEAVAAALLEKKKLTGAEVARLVYPVLPSQELSDHPF